MSLRVLFVNDDETVLSGLRGSLRRRRRRWAMQFVSGLQAVELIEQEPYDVVVTELVLRGVDGHALLERLSQCQPGTVRVVLSGAADQRGAMRAVHLAHQFLSMPCEPTELIARIERSERLRALLTSERIASLGSLDGLPSPPRLYRDLREALSDPDVSLAQISALVEQDPATSAKVLQLVNSAFFSWSRNVTNIRDAVGVLGLNLLQGLVLQIGVVNTLSAPVAGMSLEEESQHGLAVATVARRISARGLGDAAFTAGLLHDVGKLLLGDRLGKRYSEVLQAAAAEDAPPLVAIEQEALGVTHAEAGAYLLGVWGLPDAVVEGVAWHHDPTRVPHEDVNAVVAVHLADAIVRGERADSRLVEQLDLAGAVRRWRDQHEEAA
ncbi:MAG: HDOD domain-containing protein [Myxococcales bacterium]|nr:HDOD domain-containing protein [Myxococcales bacterium]